MIQYAGIGGPAEGLGAAMVDAVKPREPSLAPELIGNDARLDDEYKRHFAFVWRSLRRLGVPPELLDDAAQDVFIVALRRTAEFKKQSSYRTWLFGIACNVVREQRRSWQRARRFEPIDDGLSTLAASPLERAESAEELRFVEAFLNTLDDAKRDVFILVELEQMPVPEVAEALRIKLNTAYSRVRAARKEFLLTVQRQYGSER